MIRLKAGVAAAVLALTLAGPTAGAAFGGEITGSGKGGPDKAQPGQTGSKVKDHASECAFSGLEDEPELTGSHVQNFGHPDDPFFANAVVTRGASVVAIPVPGGTLMLGCNKNLSGDFIPS